jgi:flagellar operon protein
MSKELGQVRSPLKFSAHATQRLTERKIQLDQATMAKVNEAVDKAAAKGLEDTLILTPNSALIVNVGNRTVITAMDRGQLQGNVFTNIDGAVVI